MTELEQLEAARAELQTMLDETEGWDDVDSDAVEAFVNGEPKREKSIPSPLHKSLPDERAELIADILGGLYGDKALAMLGGEIEKGRVGTWQTGGRWYRGDGKTTVRIAGPGGKPLATKKPAAKRDTAGAATNAQATIAKIKAGKATAEDHKALVGHLSEMTVKQLGELKKEHGLKASGKVKAELVKRIAERLKGGAGEVEKPKPPEAAVTPQRLKTASVNVVKESPQPVTPQMQMAVVREVEKLPKKAKAILDSAEIKTDLVANGGITAHPAHAHLKGVTPRGYPDGYTWDVIPGGGSPGRGHPTVIVANKLQSHANKLQSHGSVNLVIHEIAHGVDNAASRHHFSSSPEWRKLHESTDWRSAYECNYPEEAFAESFAKYYNGGTSRKSLPRPVQAYFRMTFGD